MAKKSTSARARKIPEQVPLRATRMGVGQQEARAQLMTVGNQRDRGLKQLHDLKAQLHAGPNAASQDRAQKVLEQIKAKFGDAEFRRAVKDFQISFRGITQTNLLRNKGPFSELE